MANRVVVITGASAGIGEALAMELGKRGDKLVLAARRTAELERVAKACGAPAVVVQTDVTKREEVFRLRDRALESYGHVDVWVNNAGRAISASVLELTGDDIDQVIAINVKSAVYGTQAAVEHFKARGKGHVINVSSFLGKVPMAVFRAAYSGSKAMLNLMMSNLRMELLKTHPGIHVSTVMPGVVATEFHANAIHGTPQTFKPPPTGPAAAQLPTEVAVQIADLMDKPQPELFTNPAQPPLIAKYYGDVGAFEAEVANRGR